jgi:hypothetical protein
MDATPNTAVQMVRSNLVYFSGKADITIFFSPEFPPDEMEEVITKMERRAGPTLTLSARVDEHGITIFEEKPRRRKHHER